MKNILKKIFRTLVASVIILFVGLLVSLLVILLARYTPITFTIFAVMMVLTLGYLVGNSFR